MSDDINTVNTRGPGKKKRRAKKKRSKVTRGRTAANLPPAMQMTEKGLVAGSREEVAHSSGRPDRVPMQNALKLRVPPHLMEAGYYYRWFSGRPGRIAQAKAAYYEHVVDEQGNNFTREHGLHTMYFMRLPQKYRDEDLRLKKERVARTLEEEALIGHNEYAPDESGRPEGGRSAIRHHVSDSPH